MSENQLASRLDAAVDRLPDGLDGEAIDRILTEPEQKSLAEALAADAVDAAPVIGDLLTLSRMRAAEEEGIEYPTRPTAVENVISDVPPPLDTIGDILVSQNTMQYVDAYDSTAGVTTPTEVIDDATQSLDDFIESYTPGGDN